MDYPTEEAMIRSAFNGCQEVLGLKFKADSPLVLEMLGPLLIVGCRGSIHDLRKIPKQT